MFYFVKGCDSFGCKKNEVKIRKQLDSLSGDLIQERRSWLQARSSVGEHYLDTVGVGGSIPPVPTRTWQSDKTVLTRGIA